jgi:hypothetical protein
MLYVHRQRDELGGAFDTVVDLGSEMGLNVRGDMGATTEAFVANGTREGSQLEMALHVAAQVFSTRELALADVTFKWSKTGVYAHMNF